MEQRHRLSHMTNVEKELELKINQYGMLSNTIQEMLRKPHVSKDKIDVLKTELNDTLVEISILRNKIEVENLEKPQEHNNLFDSIKKNTNTASTTNEDSICEDYSEQPMGGIAESNRFSVRFNLDFEIPDFMISSVDYGNGDIYIKICDFMAEDFKGRYMPIAKVFEECDRKFSLVISHFDCADSFMYDEVFNGCQVVDVIKSSLDFTLNEIHSIFVRIAYEDIKYETA